MSLLELPNELLEHIAQDLPCSSVLQLARVNHHLRAVCQQNRLFRSVALHTPFSIDGALDHLLSSVRREQSAQTPDLSLLTWPEGKLHLEGLAWEDSARMALAIERSIRISMKGRELSMGSVTTYVDGIADSLPQLLALHHPLSLRISPSIFLPAHTHLGQIVSNTRSGDVPRSSRAAKQDESCRSDGTAATLMQQSHFICFNFILGYITLQKMATGLPTEHILDMFDTHPAFNSASRVERIISRLSASVEGYGGYTEPFVLTQATAVLLPFLLAIVSADFVVRHNPALTPFRRGIVGRKVPIPSKIPFSSFMDLPGVYRNSTEQFVVSHYAHMTTPVWLEGTWMGYYSDHRNMERNFVVDPPMRNIHMVVREPTDDAKTKHPDITASIDPKTSGSDMVNNFTLEGMVRADGSVVAQKHYAGNRFGWSWTGILTPFGIVGVWGSEQANHFGGHFWIFKQEWAEE